MTADRAALATSEFALVLLRLAQNQAERLKLSGFSAAAARLIAIDALWRAYIEAVVDTAANDRAPFPLECEDAD